MSCAYCHLGAARARVYCHEGHLNLLCHHCVERLPDAVCFQPQCEACVDLERYTDTNVTSISKTTGPQSAIESLPPENIRHDIAGPFRVHVSNLDFALAEDELRAHFVRFGRVLSVHLPRRKNGRSNGWAHVEFPSLKDARCAAELGNNTNLLDRCIRVKLDSCLEASQQLALADQKQRTSADTEGELGTGGASMLQCRTCSSIVASLSDMQLIKDGRRIEDVTGYFLVCKPDCVTNCRTVVPHPDHETQPFKMEQILCKECDSDLGNVQTGARAPGLRRSWAEKDKFLSHFRAESVVVSFGDCPQLRIRFFKWSSISNVIGEQPVEQLSMASITRALKTQALNEKEIQWITA
eukprot:TRINITY_DN61790_c0_g1_i1.p1 TRINITY_DN61790_c0_g1~~TRINITY_DN61790_c0_g1_i1.p1  ORF type:complete len:353 (+),score=51.73 TRINITY_DN61790_c0_g1_i1:76-1134(+)